MVVLHSSKVVQCSVGKGDVINFPITPQHHQPLQKSGYALVLHVMQTMMKEEHKNQAEKPEAQAAKLALHKAQFKHKRLKLEQ